MGMKTIFECGTPIQKQQLCSYIYGVIIFLHGLV
jgi:hypothetical protein